MLVGDTDAAGLGLHFSHHRDCYMQSSLTHLAQDGHQGRFPGGDAPKSHPKWSSVISEVLTKVENHFLLLTKLNGNSGCTNDKVLHTNHDHHISLLWAR